MLEASRSRVEFYLENTYARCHDALRVELQFGSQKEGIHWAVLESPVGFGHGRAPDRIERASDCTSGLETGPCFRQFCRYVVGVGRKAGRENVKQEDHPLRR